MSTNGQFAVPGLGPLTKAMAVGDAHAVHKAITQSGLPQVVSDAHGRTFHPTHTRGVYRSTDGNGKRPGHAVIVIAQHMPQSKDHGALLARLQQLLGAVGPATDGALAELKKHDGAEVDREAHTAATSPRNARPEPTGAQKKAGNYKKGHAVVGTMEISIENPQGSIRRGVGPDGKPWATVLRHHYGYIRGTKGFDKDHVDAFVKPGTSNEAAVSSPAFVVDQHKPDGKFDEHKALIGFKNKAEAKAAYLSNYGPGHEKNIGGITEMPLKRFKEWASGDGPQKGPLARQRKAA